MNRPQEPKKPHRPWKQPPQYERSLITSYVFGSDDRWYSARNDGGHKFSLTELNRLLKKVGDYENVEIEATGYSYNIGPRVLITAKPAHPNAKKKAEEKVTAEYKKKLAHYEIAKAAYSDKLRKYEFEMKKYRAWQAQKDLEVAKKRAQKAAEEARE